MMKILTLKNEIQMEFIMVHITPQRQHHVFHMLLHIQKAHKKIEVDSISLSIYCHTH